MSSLSTSAGRSRATLLLLAMCAAALGCREKSSDAAPAPTPPMASSSPEPQFVEAPKTSATPSATAATEAPTHEKIRYKLVRAEGKKGEPLTSLVAEQRGQSVTILPLEERCLDLVYEGDLDGDGLEDALVEHVTACGGNGSPSEYSFVAGKNDETFREQILGTGWTAPTVESWNGRSSILLESNNEGFHLLRPERVRRRYVFEKGRAVLAEEQRAVERKALADLRSEQFEGAEPDEERSLAFDLDEDGKPDRIVATLWERWGRMHWRVQFGDGKNTKAGGDACKRVGVLPEKTGGHHDLVCDFETHFRWNGSEYAEAAATK